MNLLVRLLKTLILALLRRGSLSITDTSSITFRVWPNDLDTNLHMNNGRYLTVADLGRLDLMVRSGQVKLLLSRRWMPVLGSATVRFRRSLMPFQQFRLKTRLLCWDSRWVFLEQVFETIDGQQAAVAVVKGVFKGPDGRSVATEEVVRAMGITQPSPPMPPEVQAWQAAEQGLAERSRAA